jgi:hypothetical protein
MPALNMNNAQVTRASDDIFEYFQFINDHAGIGGLNVIEDIPDDMRLPEDDYLLNLNIKLQDAIDEDVNPNFTQEEVNIMMQKLNIMQNLPQGERYPAEVIQAISIILGKFMNGGRRKSRKNRKSRKVRKTRVRKSRK